MHMHMAPRGAAVVLVPQLIEDAAVGQDHRSAAGEGLEYGEAVGLRGGAPGMARRRDGKMAR